MALAFIVGLLLGAGVLAGYLHTKSRRRRRIPREWPLQVRPLVNSREKRVWIWLNKVMFDQQILVKLPVTRFTSPKVSKDARHWYQLLNGVYCTFTVCNLDGKVIGCIDVPGRQGLSLSNQTLKYSLLEQCNIRYWVVDPNKLPHLTQIRAAFLGDDYMGNAASEPPESNFQDVRQNLHAAVMRRRAHRSAQAQGYDREPSLLSTSAADWEQNSFVTPLDSRRGSVNDS